jgi:ABC-type glycerol-3-phosphate transport system substrate-binding protein
MHIRPFEIALIGVFSILALIGLFFLATYQPEQTDEDRLYGDSMVIWGTLDDRVMNEFLSELSRQNQALEVVSYKEIDPRTFDSEFVNAIAEGRSPDLIILPHTLLVTHRSKLQAISFKTIDERTFRDTYIDGAEIFMRNDGIYGIPFAVDPLVMYWNRDIFSSSGLALPPKTWETLISQTTPAIVRTNDKLEITQSAVAFGEYANVTHAKDILAMLFMQSGNSIVEERESSYVVTLGRNSDTALSSADAALMFYTQFALPGKSLYTWNRSKNNDRTEFLNGSLAMYFGKGSEIVGLERDNANLNFDVASVPQESNATVRRNYGDFYAFAIPRGSKNISGAYALASLLSRADMVEPLLNGYNLAPVHRISYTGAQSDPFKNVIYQSALISRGWLDPSPRESGDLFRTMVEEITSGRARTKNVIMDAVQGLESLFR